MDFSLRCNALKCRVQLTERAVVTTCSHIFCTACSESLGLSVQANGNRNCPACNTNLPNPDDAVSTHLSPTEDYKTSVLSGLHPTTIMECAGRGIAFWVYQSTQEIAYNEYFAKSLTDKYAGLSARMDTVLSNANAELDLLSNKLYDMNLENEGLRTEQQKLKATLVDKNRLLIQTQALYDRLKRKEMTAATQSAAVDSVDDVLGSMANRQGSNQPNHPLPYQSNARPHTTQPGLSPLRMEYGGQQQLHSHNHRVRTVGSDGINSVGQMMPPPPIRGTGFGNRDFDSGHNSLPTPSHHRTQFGNLPPAVNAQSHTGNFLNPGGRLSTGRLPQQTPSSQRQPLTNVGASTINRSHMSGYGMSAGMKVGRQQEAPRDADPTANQGQERPRTVHPVAQTHEQPHQPGDGFY